MIQLQNAKIPKLFRKREKTLCSVRLHYVKKDTNISRVSTEREQCVQLPKQKTKTKTWNY